MPEFSDEERLRDIVSDYEAAKSAALARRDAQLREFHARGWRPVDLQRATGYSRETIRQALRPEVRHTVNQGRRKIAIAPHRTAPQAPHRAGPTPHRTAVPTAYQSQAPSTPHRSYGDRKPYVVAERLEDLRGPTTGVVELPRHLDWSGNASYDLDRPARLASMYRTVLNEAGSVEDLRAWLNGRVLERLWPTLWLPPQLRRLWEGRFPQLAFAPARAG